MKLPKYFFKRLSIIILVLTVITFWTEQYYLNFTDDIWYDDNESSCNVSNIKLQGGLITYISNEGKNEYGDLLWDETASEDIVRAIEKAEDDDDIKVIVLEINSLGGYPVAAEEVANALKRAKKPTVALIREYGLSAAYWSATGADIIFASQNSDVGSIGITMSYLDYAKENEKDGLTYNQLSAGKFKDTGNYDKPLTPEEKELLMRDVNILHENFIKAVSDNRKMDIEKIRELADGSDMLGQMALENNLIDQIGGRYEVEKYLIEKISEDIEICQ
ncbi:MAG: signal peptide peptidase SppA [Candidatus Pacebacteria bacterium]|nr:signal peptide peptidase SppA [Candidatus Paceibacterota bacterium]